VILNLLDSTNGFSFPNIRALMPPLAQELLYVLAPIDPRAVSIAEHVECVTIVSPISPQWITPANTLHSLVVTIGYVGVSPHRLSPQISMKRKIVLAGMLLGRLTSRRSGGYTYGSHGKSDTVEWKAAAGKELSSW
jgi:hypothetical protein